MSIEETARGFMVDRYGLCPIEAGERRDWWERGLGFAVDLITYVTGGREAGSAECGVRSGVGNAGSGNVSTEGGS